MNNKISKKLIGVPKSEEHKRKLLPILIKNRSKLILNKISNVELKLCETLDICNIEYETQYKLHEFHYDIKIKNTNILIEVDGDYYHANPKFYDITHLNKLQKNNIKYDKAKTSTAKTKQYILLRFWEYDIKNNLQNVIRKILDAIEEYKINEKNKLIPIENNFFEY